MASAENSQRTPPYKVAGLAMLAVATVVVVLVWLQFRGELTPTTRLILMTQRAGLVMDTGSKVTYDGVAIGRVVAVEMATVDGESKAKLSLDVDPKYVSLIPVNVNAGITASTVFGNKYVAFKSPKHPADQHVKNGDVIDAPSVTTEFNTLFETITAISQKIDPIKLNATLSATADALTGLGSKFGRSIVDGNAILGELNPRMPQIRYDVQRVADLADVYSNAAPDLWDALSNAVTTARTLNDERGSLDEALMAAIGFANTATDVLRRGSPYLVRGQADLRSTAQLLDEYSPELYCTIKNYHDVAPKISDALGRNGYAATTNTSILGAANPYVYPDNLPRVNARGGPGGAPGCWQPITRDLWPAPYLVMDSGASLAPYNHFELGQPMFTEYVWGRQVGENTINP